METPIKRLSREEQRLKNLEVSKKKEITFQLVSKIISWKTGSKDSSSMQAREKITIAEWKSYRKHLLNISKTEGSEVVKKKLEDIFSTIQVNEGFE